MKRDLKTLIILGLSSGIFFSAQGNPADSSSPFYSDADFFGDGNITYKLMSEDELMLQLNEKGKKLYQNLSPEGKQLALKVASASCDGNNECKGLNACKTAKNECAGQSNDCKGTGKCSFSDKNLAVKVVADKMANKRKEALKN